MATYGVITGRTQAMRQARIHATTLGHTLTKFHPSHTPSTNPYSPDEYRAECMLCGEEVFVAFKGLEWRIVEATTYQEPCRLK